LAFRGIFDNVILENTVDEDNKIQVIRLTRLGCVKGYHIVGISINFGKNLFT